MRLVLSAIIFTFATLFVLAIISLGIVLALGGVKDDEFPDDCEED